MLGGAPKTIFPAGLKRCVGLPVKLSNAGALDQKFPDPVKPGRSFSFVQQ